jgi:hypothetical protein
MYTLLEDNLMDNLKQTDYMQLVTKFVTATEDNQSTFNIPSDQFYDGFIISIGSVFVDPRRYTINNKQIIFNNQSDYVKKGRSISFIFAINQHTGQQIKLKTQSVEATIDKQNVFQSPIGYAESFIVSVGSTFVNPQKYSANNNTIVFVDEEDYIEKGRFVTFIYVDQEDNLNKHIKLDVITILTGANNQSIFNIPFTYDGCVYTKDDFIISLGNTIINQNRYNY